MNNIRIFILLLSFIINQAISQNVRSLYLTVLANTQYQCNGSFCSSSILVASSNLATCRIACLNNEQCRTLTFNQNNNQCQMFADIPSQYGTLSPHNNVITMMTIDPRKLSASTTTTTTVASTTSMTATITSTTQSLNPCISGGLLWNKTGITILNSFQVDGPANVYIGTNNTLYIVDESQYVIWKLPLNSSVSTIAAGTYGMGSSSSNNLYYPQDVYVNKKGNMYVSDCVNHRIQKFLNGSTNGSTVAGISGTSGSALNQLNIPEDFSFDDTETYMYIADSNNHRIMRYSTNSSSGTNGILVAGGTQGNTSTKLNSPFGIAYKSSLSSDLFITNFGGHSVIRWTLGASNGTFIAGIPGTSGSNSTSLNSPTGIKLDDYLNVYVADSNNHRIQIFCANSSIGITIAGTGTAGSSSMQLNIPRGFTFDSAMNLYVADRINSRVQKFMKL